MAGTTTTWGGSQAELRVVDDAELLRLAERPPEPLMPVLDRASAMWPLIVVFAMFPVTFAAYYRTYDADAALWGLRATDVLAAGSWGEVVAPGTDESRRFAGPLSSWLEAGVLALSSPAWTTAIVVVPVVSIVFTGFAVHVALRRLAGPRFALWTTMLVCCHPVVLAAGTTPAPRALGGCLQVAAFGCLLRHRISLGKVVGPWNIAAGALLGLTLLASGPAYVVGLGTATVYVVIRSVFGRGAVEPGAPPPIRGTWRSVGALGVIVGTSLVVGGWWPAAVVAEHGVGSLVGWLGLVSAPAGERITSGAVFDRIVDHGGFLLGFAVYGGWRCLRRVRAPGTEPRRVASMLVAWFGTALVAWLTAVSRVPEMGIESFREWEYAALVPLLALAVVGVESSRERTLGLLGTTLLGLVSLLVWIGLHTGLFEFSSMADGSARPWQTVREVAVFVLVVGGAIGLLLAAWRATRAEDDWQRAFATMAIVSLLVLQVAYGFVASRRVTNDDRALRQFQQQLAAWDEVRFVVLVGPETASPRVEYVVRRSWPGALVAQRANRDDAAAAILETVEPGERAVLLDTDAAGSRPFDPTGERFVVDVVSPRRLFQRRRLRAHVLVRRGDGEPVAAAEVAGGVVDAKRGH